MSAGFEILLLSLLACLLVAGALIVRRYRRSPEEKERRRRLLLHRTGRMMEAIVADFQDSLVCYSYTVGGVTYHASQDLKGLSALEAGEAFRIIGPAYIKYSPRNPANSIVACEEWSGLRRNSGAARPNEEIHLEKERLTNEKTA